MSDETTALAKTTRKGPGALRTHDIMGMLLAEMGPLKFCSYLAESGLYAKGNNAMAKIVAIIATGAELGMPPMWSLKNIVFIGDKHSILSGGVGHLVEESGYMMFHVVEKTSKRCELRWTRDGVTVGTSFFDMAKAKAAKLDKKNVWVSYPESMLYARAMTDGARTFCPAIFGGAVHTPEELGHSEVVEVTQNGRMPGVDHPDILQRPDGRAQADHGKARTTARNHLVTIVKDCTSSREGQVRVWKACLMKADKPDKMMTAEDYREAAGRVKALHEDDNLSEWCDTIHGPDEDVVGDAEVVEPDEDAEAKAWKSDNAFLHAVMGKFFDAHGLEKTGREYTIIKDVIRSNCDLPPGCEWSLVRGDAMRQMAKELEVKGGKFALIGLDPKKGDWTILAAERGAI